MYNTVFQNIRRIIKHYIYLKVMYWLWVTWHLSSPSEFWWGPCFSSFFLVFCVVILCVFTLWVSCWLLFRIKRCSVRLCLQLFVGGLMSYLRCFCLCAHSGVQNILRCVFHRIACSMLPVSLDCPFFISPSVFSNFHFLKVCSVLYNPCNLWTCVV